MKIQPQILKYALVILTIIITPNVSTGQTLYDVVISLSDRQRVVNQQSQVEIYLNNQNNDPTASDAAIPDDQPIDWLGVGMNPMQSSVDGLDIGGKIALLNQAVEEFDRLKFAFLNSSPSEFESGSVVGILKSYSSADFDTLPRASTENYNQLLGLLSNNVKSLTLISWPAAFHYKNHSGSTKVSKTIQFNGGNPPTVTKTPSDADESYFDFNPDTITTGKQLDESEDPAVSVTYMFDSRLSLSGEYEKLMESYGNFSSESKNQYYSIDYPAEVGVASAAVGATGEQIGGMVHILRRSHGNGISDVTDAPPEFISGDAGYFKCGSKASGNITLITTTPSIKIKGIYKESYSEDGITVKKFVPNGYLHGAASLSDFSHSYESNWKIGCRFYAVFKPVFVHGVDVANLRSKLELTGGILADNLADGNLKLHPRPGLLFGICMGTGVKGVGNAYISGGCMDSGWNGYYSYTPWRFDDWISMVRFDSTYSLLFAGNHTDYHVVYENMRSGRIQKLPDQGWPYTDEFNPSQTLYDVSTLYRAWESPRLKQVAGKYLIAEIVYNSSHLGGYTVNVYRRPTGSVTPLPGQLFLTTGMTRIRKWTFSHTGAGAMTGHPADTESEKLEITGLDDEKIEIQANHTLPNHGLNLGETFQISTNWWWHKEGDYSWTLKLYQGQTENFSKQIKVKTILSSDQPPIETHKTSLLESLDGQQISSLTSLTLNPFSAYFPADWKITSADKTITGSATPGLNTDRATRHGKLPSSVNIDYGSIQPNASYDWDSNGLLTSDAQGPWSTIGTVVAGAYQRTRQFNGSTYSTDWTELLDGGNKVKTYSAPDGNAANKTDTSVAWSEVEYGTAANGLPGLPFIVRNSDGTGSTYGWNASGDGSYILTLEEGVLTVSSVSRGTKRICNVNTRGYPTLNDSFVVNGGTLKTGGSFSSAPDDFTGWGMPSKVTDYNTSLASTWGYDSNLSRLSTHTSSLGVVSGYTGYDVLGRPGSVTTNGIHANDIHYTAFSTTATISGGASGSITDTRDALGRLTNGSTTWNGVTDTAVPDRSTPGILKITGSHTLFGAHRDDFNTGDGSLSLSKGDSRPFGGADGTTVVVDGGLLKTTTRLLKPGGSPTDTFTTTWTDAWGRVRKVSTPPASGSSEVKTSIVYEPLNHNASNAEPQRAIVTDKTGRITITETDPVSSSGILRRSGIDVNGNGSLGAGDRYVESLTSVSGSNVVTTLSLTEDSGLREILRTTWTPDGNKTVTIINGGEETITRTPNYGAKTVKTESTKGWDKNESFNNLGLTTSSVLSGTGVPAATLTPTWNDDGSLSGITFATGGDTHSATFKNDGTLASLNAPGKGNILGGHSISGGVETLTVDGTTTVRRLDGTLVETSGGDVIGKTEELSIPTTGAAFNHATTPAIGAATNVSLNTAGAPTAKNYAAGTGEGYTHTPGGLLQSITLASGGSLVFGYSPDGAKDLESATWPQVTSGAFTLPSVVQTYGHDRAGRVDEIGDSSGARSLAYQNGRLTGSAYTAGPLAGYEVLNPRNAQGTGTGFIAKRGGVTLHSATQVPNGVSGEISEITSGNVKIVITRNAARQATGFQWGNASGTFVPTVTQTWERGTAGRILSATSDVAGAPSFNYKGTANNEATAFDAKGRRLKCATAGGEWIYQYTSGRLSSAVHRDSGYNILLGDFSYQFDGIGRRKGKGPSGSDEPNISDPLNRTLAWTNSQNKTLKVAAHPDARVWVGIGTATPAEIPSFTGAYSYPITPPGASGGWVAWNTLAVLTGQGDAGANADAKAEQSGAIWVPPVNETLGYDAAGNRQSSALWDYGWNAKNELVRARTKNHTSAVQGYDITNAYDAQSRRFSKKVNRYQSGSMVEQKVITFLHDGNDIIYEREQLPSGLTTCERKYVWGPDISGTHGGAGGAGGLLLILETKGNVTIALYPLYDGSGNVVALTDNTGNLQAEYGYTPFGELLYARGPHAQSCPFRFATKYYDIETGLCNFGERFYDPVTCQWTSRDPLGENESLNLYDYGHGDPINNVDVQGREAVAVDAAINNGIPTMIYEEWAGSGLAYLWNAMAAGKVKTWNQAPDEGQMRRCFYFEDGAWHLHSPEARRNAFIDESIAQIPAKMEEVGPWLEMCEKGGGIAAVAPFAALAGTTEAGIGIYAYGSQALGSIWVQAPLALVGTQAAFDIATDEGIRNDTIGAIASDPNGVRATGELLGAGVSGLARMGPRAASLWEAVSDGLLPSYGGMKGFAPGRVINPFPQVRARLDLYPQVIDPRTARAIPFPSGVGQRVDKSFRVAWDSKADRAAFIAEWHRQGYAQPPGGWNQYDIHHVHPREFGGSNDFWNLVPVERGTHQSQFNSFWREFTGFW